MSGKRNWGDNMFHRRDGKEPPKPFEPGYKVPSKVWKKKYKCKKNKGDHTFAIKRLWACGRGWHQQKDGTWIKEKDWLSRWSKRWIFGVPYLVEWECTACKKQATEFSAPDKKFDKYRHSIWS